MGWVRLRGQGDRESGTGQGMQHEASVRPVYHVHAYAHHLHPLHPQRTVHCPSCTQPPKCHFADDAFLRVLLACLHVHNFREPNPTRHNTTQHNTTQHNTTQHNTTQHNTTQHNTTQHNTTQHNTTQHNTTQHKIFGFVCLNCHGVDRGGGGTFQVRVGPVLTQHRRGWGGTFYLCVGRPC